MKKNTEELSWAERQAYAAAHISDNPTLDEVMSVLDVVIEPEVRGKLSNEDMLEHVQGDLKPRGMYLVVPSHVYQKSATEVVAAVQIPMAYILWVSLRKGILTGETDQVCCATPEGYFMVDRTKAMQGLVNQMRLSLEEFEFARISEDMSGYTEPD